MKCHFCKKPLDRQLIVSKYACWRCVGKWATCATCEQLGRRDCKKPARAVFDKLRARRGKSSAKLGKWQSKSKSHTSPPSSEPKEVPPEPMMIEPTATRELQIIFADVGQGCCTIIVTPENRVILVDCGSISRTTTTDTVVPPLIEFLNKLTEASPSGKGVIDYLVISHPDADHYNLVPRLTDDKLGSKKLTVLKYCVGGRVELKELDKALGDAVKIDVPSEHSEDPGGTQRLIDIRSVEPEVDICIVIANAGTLSKPKIQSLFSTVDTSSLVTLLKELSPKKEKPGTKPNSDSIVLAIRHKGRQVLLTADATHSTEAKILSLPKWQGQLESYAISGCHHGSEDSWHDAFLLATRPSWVYFSADFQGQYMHPRASTVLRVIAACPAIKEPVFPWHGIVVGLGRPQHQALHEANTEVLDGYASAHELECRVLTNIYKEMLGFAYADKLFMRTKERFAGLEEYLTQFNEQERVASLEVLLTTGLTAMVLKWRAGKHHGPRYGEWWENVFDQLVTGQGESHVDKELLKELVLVLMELMDEELRLAKLLREGEIPKNVDSKASWWWYTTSLNVFTSQQTGNEGVYWNLKIDSNGRPTTMQL
ncbi:hypothetical protein LY474_36115 [Myxococcus stipitatus]|uniref:ComEC/Rec2 family competence protein n=1 Tax=Myxococcus stipitatus TaxID=83455 RepID=UPI001F3B9FB9|nr:hypothetical protein [Myxococcus stipitatus]MCE9673247.1 hypothetical protein [Myxococcus stipitatus]